MSEINRYGISGGAAVQVASGYFPEGQSPSSLNDGVRAVMADVRRYFQQTTPEITASGSSNNYTLTLDRDLTAGELTEGFTTAFVADFTNDASATLNINAVGAKQLRDSVGNPLSGNEIQRYQSVNAMYNKKLDSFNVTDQLMKFNAIPTFPAGTTIVADDITTGDAAVTIATTSGNITVENHASDADILFKGNDDGSVITALQLDMSDAGEANFNAGIVIPDDGTIGSASTKNAIQIDNNGNVGIKTGGTSPDYALQIATPDHTSATTGDDAEGFKVHQSGVIVHASDATNVYWFNDCSTSSGTHNYILFRYQGSNIGDIDTTNNSTIRYNTFTGAHWSQFEDHSQPNIKLGTVMSSVSTLMKWTEFTYEDSEMGPMQWRAGGHDYTIGNTYTITVDEDGTTASAKAIEHKTAKRLPMCEVSDTAGDTAVYGVFAGHYKRGESSIEALGNGEILIGSGVNVSIGDLLESAGDGTARPQTGSNKDFFKSSTIAKVTSTVKIDTHSDGSYTVPCTLHCG
tara:strand:+ start:3393 stop:4946 length:1554 start_codon:yes stop_codon:yes gene_type:complete